MYTTLWCHQHITGWDREKLPDVFLCVPVCDWLHVVCPLLVYCQLCFDVQYIHPLQWFCTCRGWRVDLNVLSSLFQEVKVLFGALLYLHFYWTSLAVPLDSLLLYVDMHTLWVRAKWAKCNDCLWHNLWTKISVRTLCMLRSPSLFFSPVTPPCSWPAVQCAVQCCSCFPLCRLSSLLHSLFSKLKSLSYYSPLAAYSVWEGMYRLNVIIPAHMVLVTAAACSHRASAVHLLRFVLELINH